MNKKQYMFVFAMVLIVVYLTGLVTGIAISWHITANLINVALKGSNINIEVDVNETELMNEFNKTVYPQIINYVEKNKNE